MFRKRATYRDGFEGHCRECRTAAARLVLAVCVAALVLGCGSAYAQDPESLGETHVRAALVLMQPTNSQAAIYLDKGFGTHPIALVATINWKLTVGQDPYKYALFRIRDGGVLTDDYWVAETSVWTAYQTHKNAETLKAASWRFSHFTLNDDYEVPKPPLPLVWEARTDALTIGYAPTATIPVVRTTSGWEWTIRGLKGIADWRAAASREAAVEAAAQSYEALP